MSTEGRGRQRAPAGYYSGLVGKGKKDREGKMAEGEKGELQSLKSLKSKRTKSKSSSRKGSRAGDFEEEQSVLSREEGQVEKELEDLEKRDAGSVFLHKRAMEGKIDFIEDIEVDEKLEEDTVWRTEMQNHDKEEEVLAARMTRLDRKRVLMERKQKIREQRLQLIKQEKEMELEEKLKQLEVRDEWFRIQQREREVEVQWQQQQDVFDQFYKAKEVENWVEKSAVHVSKGELESVRSHKLKKPGQKTGTALTVNPEGIEAHQQEAKRMQEKLKARQVPETGIQHLKRIGMLPGYGMDREPSLGQLPRQGLVGEEGEGPQEWDQLSQREEAGKMGGGEGTKAAPVDKPCTGDKEKVKVKSGKFAKSHVDLKREESWPHVNVMRQYVKRTTFEQMDFEAFVAGETRIINAMWNGEPVRARGRLRVLCKVAHWLCKCRDWSAVRGIYESIIEGVELGEMDWDSRIEGYESLLPPPPSVWERFRKEKEEKVKEKDKDREGKKSDTYWCKEYQKGLCSEASPHTLQLKPDSEPVSVVHMCASCWQKDKKKRDHPEGDAGCPHKRT